MRHEQVDEIAKAILTQGLDDWVCFSDVDSHLRSSAQSENKKQRLDACLQIIEMMLNRNWINVGDLDREKGFVPWQLGVSEIIAAIKLDASKLDRDYAPGDICWLGNTSIGDLVANERSSQNT